MKRLLKSPALWLLAAMIFSVYLRLGDPSLKPDRVPDTQGYLELAATTSWTDALSSYRTLGYPLFLRLTVGSSADLAPLPLLHLLIYLAAVLALGWAMGRFTGRSWLALAGALPLLASRPLGALLNRIQSDMLAVSLSLATVALLLAFATAPRNKAFAVALAAALFATYQVRPAYLFLIVLVPLAGPVLRLCLERDFRPSHLRSLRRWSLGLVALALGPWLLFCSLRWVTVGQFGLVSFGGYNLIGLSASMLDEDLVAELPVAQQPLARAILDKRSADGLKPFHPKALTRKWYSQFNDNVWQRAMPPLEKRLGSRDDNAPAINAELTALSKSILLRRPGLYRKWILDGFVFGASGSFDDAWNVYLGLALLLSLPILLLPKTVEEKPVWPALLGIGFVAALFLAGSLGLIVLVEVPFRRYLSTIAVLVPSVLAMILFEVIRISRLRIPGLLDSGGNTPEEIPG